MGLWKQTTVPFLLRETRKGGICMYQYESNGQLTMLVLQPYVERKKVPKSRAPKPDSELIAVPYFHLDLSEGNVDLFGNHYWEMRSPLREGKPPLNTGVAPR